MAQHSLTKAGKEEVRAETARVLAERDRKLKGSGMAAKTEKRLRGRGSRIAAALRRAGAE